jgi:uncharacterized protein DUF6788
MLTRSSLTPAERNFYAKLHQLLSRPGLVRGSLVEMRRTCGKEGCRCQRGRGQRHRSLYLGFKLNGRQQMIYVPTDWEDRVRTWVQRYAQIRDVLEEVSAAFVKRLKSREE